MTCHEQRKRIGHRPGRQRNQETSARNTCTTPEFPGTEGPDAYDGDVMEPGAAHALVDDLIDQRLRAMPRARQCRRALPQEQAIRAVVQICKIVIARHGEALSPHSGKTYACAVVRFYRL